MPLLAYQQVVERLPNGRAHLLVGNGLSIECDPVFAYTSLFQKAVDSGLSERAQRVFEGLGTNNFEGVMRLLSDTHWVARTYGLVDGDTSEMLADVDVVKRALVEAITQSHLPHAGAVLPERKAAAAAFFQPYLRQTRRQVSGAVGFLVSLQTDGKTLSMRYGNCSSSFLGSLKRLRRTRRLP
jgi:hypothetical protein